VVNSADISALTSYITDGTAFPSGESAFIRVRLELEPLTDQVSSLASDGTSTLRIEDADTDLLTTFSAAVDFSVEFIPTWYPEQVVITDLRRFVNSASLDFDATDLTAATPTGGKNNLFVPGDTYLLGNILNSDGSFHRLDYERAILDFELPDGSTEAEVNIFQTFVKDKLYFSDGTLVSASALNNSQIIFEVKVSSYAKNMGLSVDGYVDYFDIGDSADEAVGTYIDQSTGLMRIRAYNIVNNDLRPEIRTRIQVVVNLKKAGWRNLPVTISAADLSSVLTPV
jgi:hypothetical protein